MLPMNLQVLFIKIPQQIRNLYNITSFLQKYIKSLSPVALLGVVGKTTPVIPRRYYLIEDWVISIFSNCNDGLSSGFTLFHLF